MVADPYLLKRLDALERELAELRAEFTKKRRVRKGKVRGAGKGAVTIEEVKQVRRELFQKVKDAQD